MNLRKSSGRAAYLRQQHYAKLAAFNIQRQFDNQKYGKMKEEQQQANKAKLKCLIELCENEFSVDASVSAVLQEYFSKWKKYKYGRSYHGAIENIRYALANFSMEVREQFESIVKIAEENYEREVKEIRKRKEREEFKKRFMELQEQRKQAK